MKIVLCLALVFVLTNGLPVRYRDSEDFKDSAREIIPKERSAFEDLYDEYLRRRESNKGARVRGGKLRLILFTALIFYVYLYAVIYFVFTDRLEEDFLPQAESDFPGTFTFL